ncbi:MAG TPA: S9 family peptidase [Thermoanaerobaculia bacterium]|nr:S9 family peptidase [Thermoanaerobaculia bacterium]
MIRSLFVSLLMLAPFAGVAATGIPAPLTVEDYVTMPSISAPEFSPDGSRIVYVVSHANFERAAYDTNLWIVNADGTGNVQLTRGAQADSSPHWSPDGKSVAFVSGRVKPAGLWVISVGGGEAEKITSEATAVRGFRWSPDGKSIAFVRSDAPSGEEEAREKRKDDVRVVGQNDRYARLYAIDVATRRVRRLTGGPFTVGSFDWSPDGRTIAFARAAGAGLDDLYRSDIYSVDASGECGRSCPDLKPLVRQPGIDTRPSFSPDGRMIAFESGGGIHDWLHPQQIYVLTLADGKIRLASAAYDRVPESYFWSADSKSIWVNGPWNTTTQLFRVNADGTGFTNVSNVNGDLEDADVDVKRGRVAFVYQSLTEGPELFIGDLTGKGAKSARRRIGSLPALQLTNLNASYLDRKLGETRLIRWKNPKDGLEIEGLLTLPIGYKTGQSVPLLTVVHGGPGSRFTQAYLGYLANIYPVHVFASKGFAVLRPNPRGTGGYGSKFFAANRNDWGGMDWVDINAGIDKLIDDGIADPQRLGIMGWSYGGFMTAWAAGHSDRFKAISIGAPVVDLLSFHATTDIRDFIPSYFPGAQQAAFFPPNSDTAPADTQAGIAEGETAALQPLRHAPLSYDLLREHSPLWHLKPTKSAILIQHGDADDRVPLSQGMMLYRTLQELGANVQMVIYPRSPHVPREPREKVDAGERNVEFMTRYVK